ncbi:MAG: dihydroneopterin aldolase [Paludibacter sp.]
MSKISLENMEFHAFHGCLEHEQTLGNTFIVNVSMELDTKLAGETDNLEHTLNYQLVYDVVKEQMEIPSKLIEHVGQRILDNIMSSFPQIEALVVQLSKLSPPLGGKVERVTIELSKKKVISIY